MRCAILTGLILVIDQITKMIVENTITSPIKVIPGLFNLVFVKNTGAAWGILAGKGWLLLVISAVVFVLIVVFIRRITEGWIERYYAMALIAGGIAGNSIDRIWRGAVVDFLDFHYGSHHWPAFNVADSAICVGVFIFIISSWIRPQPGVESPSSKA
jgi:signal peptidase II